MNERIKELAEQAAGNFTENFKWDHLLEIDKDIFEKFAELIVRECAKQVDDFYQENEFTCYCAAETIKEHFGVEE